MYRVTYTTPYEGHVDRLRQLLSERKIDSLVVSEENEEPRKEVAMVNGKSQEDRILSLLSDGMPHRTDEILARCYGSKHLGLARIPSRMSDLRLKKGHAISMAKQDPNYPTLHWYRLEKTTNQTTPLS